MKNRRSGKFYRKNEKEVMEMLGLEPTPNSGSGWVIKEDGQNENVIAQLKSTDALSISISKLDLDKLEYNAKVAKKLPIFVVQFLQDNGIYLLLKANDLENIAKYVKDGTNESSKLIDININEGYKKSKVKRKVITSNSKVREMLHEEREKKFNKSKSAR